VNHRFLYNLTLCLDGGLFSKRPRTSLPKLVPKLIPLRDMDALFATSCKGESPNLVPPQLEPQHIKPRRSPSEFATPTGCQLLTDQALIHRRYDNLCAGVRKIEPVARHRMWQLTGSQTAPTPTFSDMCLALERRNCYRGTN
jgi:hypothetical protein